MRDHRRVPRLLWLASIVGLLFLLISIGMLIIDLVTGLWSSGSLGVTFNALTPIFLGLACSFAELLYRTYLPLPDRGLIRLDSWQTLVVASVLVLVPPLCAFALALVLPPTLTSFSVIYAISMLAGLHFILASAIVLIGTPPR